ncbi:MAG TPA: hypothetical protein QGH18_06115, partial [Arenicellales bacterium]|nr:hypothetical protein [Arenicellales bacterium]
RSAAAPDNQKHTLEAAPHQAARGYHSSEPLLGFGRFLIHPIDLSPGLTLPVALANAPPYSPVIKNHFCKASKNGQVTPYPGPPTEHCRRFVFGGSHFTTYIPAAKNSEHISQYCGYLNY